MHGLNFLRGLGMNGGLPDRWEALFFGFLCNIIVLIVGLEGFLLVVRAKHMPTFLGLCQVANAQF